MNEKKTMLSGLTTAEAKIHLKKYGENVVFKKKKSKAIIVFLSKFKSPLLILLISISVVSFSLGQRTSATIVMMMVFLSAILDFLNSYKSQQAVEKLVSRVSIKVTAIRDGQKKEIDFKDIVPDDLIFLSAGNIIPADCQVLESDDFFVNQSSLTGESIPVEKAQSGADEAGKIKTESVNFIFMGTSVVSGFATVKVLKTGEHTEFGKIAKDLSSPKLKTDFEVSLTKFSLFVLKLVFFMASFVFLIYLIKNVGSLNKAIILEAFTFALAITIGMTPDMLPAIMTICLSKGSQLMAKKEVIVKHLPSIESFGSMDILCTDKTGTLTQDHIALVKFIDYSGQDSEKVLSLGYLSSIYHTGVQNPLDDAIKDYRQQEIAQYEKIDEIPYDFTRKRSSMVVRSGAKRLIITKGAPEEIVKICIFCELNDRQCDYGEQKNKIEEKFRALSQEGFRVLGLCYKELPDSDQTVYEKEEENGMIFAGFLAFLDPPKEGVYKTIEELKILGIDIKILTGDNDLLAQKICSDIGLEIKGVINGREIEEMNDVQLENKIIEANVFARVTPSQKERIILVLKKSGKTVGYLGDGINDAPALKAADVGISVNNAVDIAKETADIILMQKSLESLKDGIIEGRKTFHNTMKYILMGLSSNFGNMFSMMGAATFLPFLPMLPSQILLNNFIYDTSQFSLPTDSVDEEELLKPAHLDIKFIRNYMIVFGWMSSIFDFLTFFLLYYLYQLSPHQFQTGWFIESIATQVFVIYIIRTKKLPFIKSMPSKALMITTVLAVAIAWSIQYTILGRLMQFDRLPSSIMVIIFGYVLVYLVLVEIVKRFFYRHIEKKSRQKAILKLANA